MFHALRQFLLPKTVPAAPLPRVPLGTRYYVIGDIHGRLDLYEPLIEAIEADERAFPGAKTRIILLGDLVDRGPHSAGVIARTREWKEQRSNVRVLAGNHEQMFLGACDRPEVLKHFLKIGGIETILSYGLSRKQIALMEIDDLFEAVQDIIPQADLDFVANFEDMIIAGDYLFVHAGIDPHTPIDKQKRSDMLWIREKFLDHEGPLEKVVVHGHTIFEQVMDCGNRIGIDTGAFRTGVLTALVLEADQRRTIQTIAHEGAIEVFHGDRAR